MPFSGLTPGLALERAACSIVPTFHSPVREAARSGEKKERRRHEKIAYLKRRENNLHKFVPFDRFNCCTGARPGLELEPQPRGVPNRRPSWERRCEGWAGGGGRGRLLLRWLKRRWQRFRDALCV